MFYELDQKNGRASSAGERAMTRKRRYVPVFRMPTGLRKSWAVYVSTDMPNWLSWVIYMGRNSVQVLVSLLRFNGAVQQ